MYLKIFFLASVLTLVAGGNVSQKSKCIEWVVTTLQSSVDSGLLEGYSPCEGASCKTEVDEEDTTRRDRDKCKCDGEIKYLTDEIRDLRETVKLLWASSDAAADFCLTGMKSGSVPTAAITASTYYNHIHCYIENARLDDDAGGWCAAANNVNQWIQVDLGSEQTVTGVVTQGRINAAQWITEFKVTYGNEDLMPIMDGDIEKVFIANTDHKRREYNRFPYPVKARFVRIHPTGWHGHISMRFDLTSC